MIWVETHLELLLSIVSAIICITFGICIGALIILSWWARVERKKAAGLVNPADSKGVPVHSLTMNPSDEELYL